jgi:hypothetical protein
MEVHVAHVDSQNSLTMYFKYVETVQLRNNCCLIKGVTSIKVYENLIPVFDKKTNTILEKEV